MGLFYAAVRAGVPVVPLALHGTGAAMAKGAADMAQARGSERDARRVHLRIGAPAGAEVGRIQAGAGRGSARPHARAVVEMQSQLGVDGATQAVSRGPRAATFGPGGVTATGGSFLVEERTPEEVFTPEDLSDEQRMIAGTAAEFMEDEVLPRLDAILALDYEATRETLAQGRAARLAGDRDPQAYGGLGLGNAVGCRPANHSRGDGSFVLSFLAHTGMGTLPIVLFRDRGAEAEVPAAVRHGGVDQLLLALGGLVGQRRPGRQGPRRRVSRWPALDPRRREDVADQCGHRGRLHHLRQGERRAPQRVHRREGIRPA